MKKTLILLLFFIIFYGYHEAIATTLTIDLSTLTIEELDGLSSRISDERKKATIVTSREKRLLESDFMKAVEEINPSGTTFSYPFFGLSIVHQQYYYCVCGTVGCHFPDKKNKDLWDATIIYWHDKETNEFHRAAFYTRDEVFFVDQAALAYVTHYAEKVALENLARLNILIEEVGTRGVIAQANTWVIDFENMTIDDLDALTKEVEKEKIQATEVSIKIKKKLEADFMETVEALMPSGTKISYPFYGLSIVHRRNYYCVCGTVGCSLPDKTKKDLWDATIIYCYDENNEIIRQAAFYTKDTVYYVDDNALRQVEHNLEPIARVNLTRHNIFVEPLALESTIPTATPTLIPTQKPTATPTLLPTKKSTTLPTIVPTKKPTATPTIVPTNTPMLKTNVQPTKTPSKKGTFSFGARKTEIPESNKNRFTKEIARKVVLTVIINDLSLDIFTANGNYYDEKKFHDYDLFFTRAEVIDEGTWNYNDNGTWQVSKILIYDKTGHRYYQYDFTIRFDGRYYYAEDGWSIHAAQRKWLDKTDPSKYGEDNLSNLDFYTYCKVRPSQIGE